MRKLITSAAAIIMTASIAVSSVASAASITFCTCKDPNGDKKLTIADSTTIQMYLGGYNVPSNIDQYDMDNNGVVSAVDYELINMYDAGMITGTCNNCDHDCVEENPINTTEKDRYYVVFDAKSGSLLRDYQLTVNIDNISTLSQPDSVIGDDEREVDWSNEGVVKIITNEARGTGFVVGKHLIATAAHVVNNSSIKHIYAFESDYDNTVENSDKMIDLTPVEYHIPTSYRYEPDKKHNYDYALITVEEDLSEYMSFNLGSITNRAINDGIEVSIIGFPGTLTKNNGEEIRVNEDNLHTKVVSYGNIVQGYNDAWIECDFDATNGTSGGPLIVEETLNGVKYNTVVGIWFASYVDVDDGTPISNLSTKFDAHILKFFKINDK